MTQENLDHIVLAASHIIKRGLEKTKTAALNRALDFFEQRDSVSNSEWVVCFNRITILEGNIDDEEIIPCYNEENGYRGYYDPNFNYGD